MQTEQKDVIPTVTTRNLPYQTLHLPYVKPACWSTRILRPPDQSEVNSDYLPLDMIPQRLQQPIVLSWDIADLQGKQVWFERFNYTRIHTYMKDLIPNHYLKTALAHKFKIVYQFEMHQSMQHAGLLAFFWRPGVEMKPLISSFGDRQDTGSMQHTFLYHPRLISPQTGGVYEFEVPIRQHMLNFMYEQHTFMPDYEFGSFYVTVISPLSTVSEITALPIRLSVRLEGYTPILTHGWSD